ncbi:MAG: ribbon-helix-helix domain-containing protein, partial [Dongiaceae bacterium]
LKLDDVVWQSLDELAAEAKLRLNELVAKIAATCADQENLTGALRLYCLTEIKAQNRELEREVRTLALTGQGVPAALFAQACPSPCLVIGAGNLIQYVNEPAQKWMSAQESALINTNVEHYFQIKSVPLLPEIVQKFSEGARKVFPTRLVHVRPGRLVMARANICPAMINSGGEVLYFMIIET